MISISGMYGHALFGVLFSLLFALGCAVTTTVPSKDDSDRSFEVMSFNIRYNTPSDSENAWPNRKDMAAGLIRFHDADFAGLQEALLGQIQDLDARLPNYDWFGVGRDDGDTEGEFTPIFYRPDRFELLEHDTFWLSDTPEVPGSKSWDTAITRIATWGIFRDRRHGREFLVLNAHYDHLGTEARKESSRLILEKIGEIAPDLPVVVTGDFNTKEDTEPYEILTGGLRDAYYASETPHYGPGSTWNDFREVQPGVRIDYIFVGPDVRVLRHGILSETMDGRFPSDHLPVLAEVELKE